MRPDDVFVTFYDVGRANVSFGKGIGQRALRGQTMTDAPSHCIRSEAEAPPRLYLEDFAVGQVYGAGPIRAPGPSVIRAGTRDLL